MRQCRNLSDSQCSSVVSGAFPHRSSHSIDTHRNTCLWWAWGPQTRYRWPHIWEIPPHSRSTAGRQNSYNHNLPSQAHFGDTVVYYIRFLAYCYEFTCSKRTTFSGWNVHPGTCGKTSIRSHTHPHKTSVKKQHKVRLDDGRIPASEDGSEGNINDWGRKEDEKS